MIRKSHGFLITMHIKTGDGSRFYLEIYIKLFQRLFAKESFYFRVEISTFEIMRISSKVQSLSHYPLSRLSFLFLMLLNQQ